MAEMGRYCKAYHVRQLREFPGWQPNLQNLRPESAIVDGQDVQQTRTELTDDDVLFVQENYVVTDGIFLDEHLVFETPAPEWKAFCTGMLAFEVPADEVPQSQEAVPASV